MKRRPKDLSPELKERIQNLFDMDSIVMQDNGNIYVDFVSEELVVAKQGEMGEAGRMIHIPMHILDKMLVIMHNDCVTVKPEKKKQNAKRSKTK